MVEVSWKPCACFGGSLHLCHPTVGPGPSTVGPHGSTAWGWPNFWKRLRGALWALPPGLCPPVTSTHLQPKTTSHRSKVFSEGSGAQRTGRWAENRKISHAMDRPVWVMGGRLMVHRLHHGCLISSWVLGGSIIEQCPMISRVHISRTMLVLHGWRGKFTWRGQTMHSFAGWLEPRREELSRPCEDDSRVFRFE